MRELVEGDKEVHLPAKLRLSWIVVTGPRAWAAQLLSNG
jgi:hypothetical protein